MELVSVGACFEVLEPIAGLRWDSFGREAGVSCGRGGRGRSVARGGSIRHNSIEE